MRKTSKPLVRDAFAVSTASGTLQAIEAGINGARQYIGTLPAEPGRRIEAALTACWTQCMLAFAGARETVQEGATEAGRQAALLNQENAGLTMTLALEALAEARREPANETAGARMEKLLLDVATLIGRLFAEGEAEGLAIKAGARLALRSGGHKTV